MEHIDAAAGLRGFLRGAGGFAVLDGGLATELEAHGADLQDELWSANCLVSAPHLIRKVHLDYLEAGANIITSASYQATIEGFESRGVSREQSEALLRRSVHVAQEARAVFDREDRPVLVAASIGSYGAYLADGSDGDYGKSVTKEALKDFHRRRLQVLASAGPDLIAFETIPNKLEAQAYVELLEEEDIRIPAWFSFTSKDGINAASGDSITDCAAVADSCDRVTDKPVIVYPNSGETYNAETKEWENSDDASGTDLASHVGKWRQAGAAIVGGCCRTSPATVRAIARALQEEAAVDENCDDFPAVAVL
ncbi:hypothetical protein PR202_ga09486 [Eleusine coracana subsp. coracana]|uniref:Hcy-binding domain-containing protein n=1 Tax=Eleusine coracana subsp. coracana TaxID=191504 RepID=A0AAV5C398_ELECO|nr:hypothetical protein PR202_ga09486 [Eleusine coracana subsp. coracana]